MEDFTPYDGRRPVLVQWNSRLFRLLPGAMERPTQVVRQHRLLASVIDPILRPALGFGLADAGELLLRRIDRVAVALSPVWTEGPAGEIGDPATVTEAEVAAIARVPHMDALASECLDSVAAARALDRYTISSKKLRGDALSMMVASTFGSTMAVRVGSSRIALPAGLLLEILPEIARDLTAIAVRLEARVEQRWHREVDNQIGRRLQGTGHKIAGPARVGPDGHIHSLVFFDDRRVLAIGNCAALTADGKSERIWSDSQHLKRVQPGVTVRTAMGDVTIPDDAQVLHAQVTAGPVFTGAVGLMLPTFGLDDLEWILYSERGDHDDLWYFIRDLTVTPGLANQVAWDLIDKWEAWHPDKSFYSGAETLDLMTFEAHTAVAEWNDAAEASSAELALHRLGLPSLRDWPAAHLRGACGFEIADLNTDQVLTVLPWRIPVCINRTDPDAPRVHGDTLWRLSIGADWKLGHSKEAFLTAADGSEINALHIGFRFQDRNDGPALTLEDYDSSGALTIGWDPRLQMLLAADSYAIEAELGRVIGTTIAPVFRAAFVQAWDAAPPGIRVDGYNVQQCARGLSEPLAVHETLLIDVQRDLATSLREDGLSPGSFIGSDASALESRRVFPWLLGRFHETIARFDSDALLMFALVQLECASSQRFMVEKRLGWSQGFPVTGDAIEDDQRERVARSTRILHLIIEEVLARPPAGARTVDDASWAQVLAVAELCIESCFRSDAIHWRLRDVSVDLSELFEISIHSSGDPTDIDMGAYEAARAVATRRFTPCQ